MPQLNKAQPNKLFFLSKLSLGVNQVLNFDWHKQSKKWEDCNIFSSYSFLLKVWMQALEANKGTYHSFSSPMIEGQSEEGNKNQMETYLITFPWSFKWELYMTSHKLL